MGEQLDLSGSRPRKAWIVGGGLLLMLAVCLGSAIWLRLAVPAAAHYQATDPESFRRLCEALMDTPQLHGSHPASYFLHHLEQAEGPESEQVELSSLEGIRELVQVLETESVSVRDNRVSFTWECAPWFWQRKDVTGYSLTVYRLDERGVGGSPLNVHGKQEVLIAPGVWATHDALFW